MKGDEFKSADFRLRFGIPEPFFPSPSSHASVLHRRYRRQSRAGKFACRPCGDCDRNRRSIDRANAENASGGSGLTPPIYRELLAAGIDGITLGDHVYKRREIIPILQNEHRIVRPANYPAEAPGPE